jgi:hypothetical protein
MGTAISASRHGYGNTSQVGVTYSKTGQESSTGRRAYSSFVTLQCVCRCADHATHRDPNLRRHQLQERGTAPCDSGICMQSPKRRLLLGYKIPNLNRIRFPRSMPYKFVLDH